MTHHPTLTAVFTRIRERSASTRLAYLNTINAMKARPPRTHRYGCANLAHVTAVMDKTEKKIFMAQRKPHLAIVTAYNDMLSAHQPYETYPAQIRLLAHQHGATVQVAGGVPAMCDGITQGAPGMELSLFSRDIIAQSTAISLSHDVFDGALLLGICDKIVPGLLIGALHFGHLPCVFVPSGPMATGASHQEKSKVREQYQSGLVSKEALQHIEEETYHSPGTCTFYGTANSNQLLLEAMGLILPNSAFVPPHSPQRAVDTEIAVVELIRLCLADGRPHQGIGELVGEAAVVNAMVALLATGGSTNHLIHWVAVAKSAGIQINWDDFAALSAVVPLIVRMYPNGSADVNAFHQAGGVPVVLSALMQAGLLFESAGSIHPQGLLAGKPANTLKSLDTSIIRTAENPFMTTGGLKILQGNIGRAVIKTSAIADPDFSLTAKAMVFESQEAVQQAFQEGALQGDLIVVVRFQGPRANGMPELHKLIPLLSSLQNRGQKVALLTDGRLSGASGKAPAAIHLYPEALAGGNLAKIMTGDLLEMDVRQGRVELLVSASELARRPLATMQPSTEGYGRRLFTHARQCVSQAEAGATIW
jgi:phosphogluconate dehydratase